jgi:hypothetical protein
MALTMPEATLVGIDLAAEPIAQGNRIISDLALTNITLKQGDLLQVGRDEGQFDYIITHGLYSWAPPIVRDAILRISSENLSRHGIAYVSYNSLPGGRIRQMLREMMLFHAAEIGDPMERARQARDLLLLIAHGRTRDDAFNVLVREEVVRMTDRDLWYLFHDELADVYEPVYFHQFVEHAAKYRLQYLADANLYNLQPAMLTPEAQDAVARIAGEDRVLQQQYVDFVQSRRFHHTLLCHERAAVDYPPTPARLEKLFVSTAATSVSPQPDLSDGVEEEFRGPLGSSMKTGNGIAKTLFAALINEAPQALSFRELTSRAGRRKSRAEIGQILLATSLAGLTDLHTGPLPLVTNAGPHPTASPLARHQLARQRPITTLTHSVLENPDQSLLRLLALLDGKRSRATLMRKLSLSANALDDRLRKLGKLGLLLN